MTKALCRTAQGFLCYFSLSLKQARLAGDLRVADAAELLGVLRGQEILFRKSSSVCCCAGES